MVNDSPAARRGSLRRQVVERLGQTTQQVVQQPAVPLWHAGQQAAHRGELLALAQRVALAVSQELASVDIQLQPVRLAKISGSAASFRHLADRSVS